MQPAPLNLTQHHKVPVASIQFEKIALLFSKHSLFYDVKAFFAVGGKYRITLL